MIPNIVQCYVKSCQHVVNSSFAFWNSLEFFFLIFLIQSLLNPPVDRGLNVYHSSQKT